MRLNWSDQYRCGCIVLDGGETFAQVLNFPEIHNAMYFDGEDHCFVVEFPDRFPELYTYESLQRSMK